MLTFKLVSLFNGLSDIVDVRLMLKRKPNDFTEQHGDVANVIVQTNSKILNIYDFFG